MGVAALFLLSSLCLFAVTAQAQQCSKPSGGPNMDLKPEYILNTTFVDGATVAFSCNPGYTSAGGSATITCTAGQWSALQLKCERKNCGTLGEVANGDVTYINGTEFGDTAKVTCKPGYNLVGSAVIRCGVEGWTARLPTCEVVKCVKPGGIVNGTFSPVKEFYDYREVVQYSCNKDLELNGSRELTCSENGNFSPAPPTCVWVECKDPVIENGQYESGSRPPHRLNAALTYSCKTGYTMEGPSTVTCNLTSQWFPSLPKCNKIPDPTRPPTTTVSSTVSTTVSSTVSSTTGTIAVTTKGPSGHGNSLSPGIIALIVIVSFIIFAVCIICAVYCYRKKRKHHGPVDAKLYHLKVSS